MMCGWIEPGLPQTYSVIREQTLQVSISTQSARCAYLLLPACAAPHLSTASPSSARTDLLKPSSISVRPNCLGWSHIHLLNSLAQTMRA